MATLLEGVGLEIFKEKSKNVLNSFLAVFCCKVGVYYDFNSEISYQSWCCKNKKIATMLLLVKCNDNKMVKSPGFSFVEKTHAANQKKGALKSRNDEHTIPGTVFRLYLSFIVSPGLFLVQNLQV